MSDMAMSDMAFQALRATIRAEVSPTTSRQLSTSSRAMSRRNQAHPSKNLRWSVLSAETGVNVRTTRFDQFMFGQGLSAEDKVSFVLIHLILEATTDRNQSLAGMGIESTRLKHESRRGFSPEAHVIYDEGIDRVWTDHSLSFTYWGKARTDRSSLTEHE